jgi:hypothetical protein
MCAENELEFMASCFSHSNFNSRQAENAFAEPFSTTNTETSDPINKRKQRQLPKT